MREAAFALPGLVEFLIDGHVQFLLLIVLLIVHLIGIGGSCCTAPKTSQID